MICDRLARDSTLLIIVGCPHRPLTDGKAAEATRPALAFERCDEGGFSPHTKAPAPSRTSALKLKSVPGCCCPGVRRPLPAGSPSRCVGWPVVLGPDVEEARAGSDYKSAEDHAFENGVGIAFEDAAVHVGAGIASSPLHTMMCSAPFDSRVRVHLSQAGNPHRRGLEGR